MPVPDSPAPEAVPPRRSLWAVASFFTSLFVCPPMCLIGPVLGVVGLLQIRLRPQYTGRALAVVGIVLGLMATAGWGAGAVWWNANVRVPMLAGPVDALRQGYAGDPIGFRLAFDGGERRDDAEANRFIETLRTRYGGFRSIQVDRSDDAFASRPGGGRVRIPYLATFDRATLPLEAEFVINDDGSLPMIVKWGWLAVRDPEQGDLTYPSAVAPAASPAASVDSVPDEQ